MTRPTAAPNVWPYSHRSVEEVDAATGVVSSQILYLDNLSRNRALTDAESNRLGRLLKAALHPA